MICRLSLRRLASLSVVLNSNIRYLASIVPFPVSHARSGNRRIGRVIFTLVRTRATGRMLTACHGT
jgi:hypothetical protein